MNDVYRASVDAECLEKCLKPMSAFVKVTLPEINAMERRRGEMVIDYDAHRRRLKAKQVERDAAEAERKNLEAQGKPSKSTDAINAEVNKYEVKGTVFFIFCLLPFASSLFLLPLLFAVFLFFSFLFNT